MTRKTTAKRKAVKSAPKRAVSRKGIAKKRVPSAVKKKSAGATKKVPAKKRQPKVSDGHRKDLTTGIYLPTDTSSQKPIAPTKMKKGITAAKKQISVLLDQFQGMTDGYSLDEIELQASFSADGKFMGIGVGGATTITLRFKLNED